MEEIEKFKNEVIQNISAQGKDITLKESAAAFMTASIRSKYSYNFSWLGRPIIQYPQDIIAIQEIIYQVQPDLIIETGIAHGGSLIFHASICELIGKGEVLGIDIDIREHNRSKIVNHKVSNRISMLQGSSVAPDIVEQVWQRVRGKEAVMVILDSNHTHAHVLKELMHYSRFVTKDSYLLVFDTVVENLPEDTNIGRPWGIGNNPKTAVEEFLKSNNNFVIDHSVDDKLLISVAPGGFLKRVQ